MLVATLIDNFVIGVVCEDTCQWINSNINSNILLGSEEANIITNQSRYRGEVELSVELMQKSETVDPFEVDLQFPVLCPFKRLMVNEPAAHHSPQALVSETCT